MITPEKSVLLAANWFTTSLAGGQERILAFLAFQKPERIFGSTDGIIEFMLSVVIYTYTDLQFVTVEKGRLLCKVYLINDTAPVQAESTEEKKKIQYVSEYWLFDTAGFFPKAVF